MIVDLLRFPLVNYLGTTIIKVLEFTFKYSAIIGISHYFISRSGDLVNVKEKKIFQKCWKVAFISAAVILLAIIITEVLQFITINKLSKTSDEYLDNAYHDCHRKLTIIVDFFWLASNVMLLCLGLRIRNASLNCNLRLISLENDSFHRKGEERKKVIEIREQQIKKMMFILYVMLAVSTYSILNGLQKFIFFSSDCNPTHMPHEVSSLIDFLDYFVTRQLWVYITV